MSDWPALSWRSRIFGAAVVGLTLVHFGVVVTGLQEGPPPHLASTLGTLVLLASLAMMAWVVVSLHGRLAPPRWAAVAVVTGAGLRVWGLLPVTYDLVSPPLVIPPRTQLYAIAIAYVFFAVGYAAIIVAYQAGASYRQPLGWSTTGALAVGVVFAFAAFGPLPQVPTQLTVRDSFAMALLAADILLLAQASYITFVNLQHAGGVLVRAWLWIALSSLMVAMGDAVWPLLSVYDSARYIPPLWGLAYSLGAFGASVMLDTLDAEEPRPTITGASPPTAERRDPNS